MAEYTREQKLKILENLPQDLQNFIESEDTGAVLLSLGIKYNLADDKVRLLSKIVGNVALGLLPLTNLSQEINTQITPDMQIALNLAQDLNVELFFPVVESLKQAPTIANAVLTGQPAPVIKPAPAPALVPAPAPTPAPAAPAQVPSFKFQVPSSTRPDQYREPAEAISGPLKPKIGPEPIATLRPVAPPVVTLRPLETMKTLPILPPIPSEQQNRVPTESRILDKIGRFLISQPNPKDLGEIGTKPVAPAPAPMPAPAPLGEARPEGRVPMPAPMPVPQPITAEGGTPPKAVVKVPLPTPAPQPAPIKIPVAPAPSPTPIPAQTPALPILPPTPSELQNRGSSISQPNPKDLGEIGTKPLTFTRPVMPPTPVQPAPAPIPVPAVKPNLNPITYNLKPDSYREPVEFAPLPVPPQLPTEEMAHPTIDKQQTTDNKTMPTKQFIASPAETPIDLEESVSDIVDLRQDKGRF